MDWYNICNMPDKGQEMNNVIKTQFDLSANKGFTAEKIHGKAKRTIVTIGQGELVEASDDNQEVFTFGTLGCNVVAVLGRRNRKRFGAVTHYDPININGNVKKIKELGNRAGQEQKGDETSAEVFVPGDWENVNGKWAMKPRDVQETDLLVNSTRDAFGKKTKVTIIPYSELKKIGKKHQGEVSVDISDSPSRKKRIVGIF